MLSFEQWWRLRGLRSRFRLLCRLGFHRWRLSFMRDGGWVWHCARCPRAAHVGEHLGVDYPRAGIGR